MKVTNSTSGWIVATFSGTPSTPTTVFAESPKLLPLESGSLHDPVQIDEHGSYGTQHEAWHPAKNGLAPLRVPSARQAVGFLPLLSLTTHGSCPLVRESDLPAR
jgi:hypothetical protein